MAFLLKITPPLTFSSSEPLVENVVSVVSVVSQNRILQKNRYLFLPVRSPVFVLSKSLFRHSQSPVAHPPIPLPSSRSPLPSSPFSSKSRFRPLPSSSSKPKKTAERHEAVPPYSWWLVVCSKTEHSSPPPPMPETVQTREPRRWHSRLLLLRPKWRRPHWCQG